MLHPSYTDLMQVVNQDVEEGATKVVNSRYSIVLATAKRAREISEDENREVKKPVIEAIREINSGEVVVVANASSKVQDPENDTEDLFGDDLDAFAE